MTKQLVKKQQIITQKLGHLVADPYSVYLDGLSPSGRRSMNSQLMGVLRLMDYHGIPEVFPWENLRYVHIVKVRALLQGQGKSANTINTTLSAVKGVIRAAFNMGLISADDYLRTRAVKQVKNHRLPVGRSLKPIEVKKMLTVCKRDKSTLGVRDAAIIALMVSTGLRRTEIVSINKQDYMSPKGVLIVHQGKGNRQRLAVITTSTKALLNKWMKIRGQKVGALFTRIIADRPTNNRISAQSIYNIIQIRSEQAGIDRCTPHDLRRTLVTRLLDAGIDLNTVRQIIGHQNVNTTARYDRRGEQVKHKIIQNLCIF